MIDLQETISDHHTSKRIIDILVDLVQTLRDQVDTLNEDIKSHKYYENLCDTILLDYENQIRNLKQTIRDSVNRTPQTTTS